MTVGRFYGGVAAVVSSAIDGKYLLLKRSQKKDFAAGVWECVTGRVDQGEGFLDALTREVHEELGVAVQVDFIVGTTHFYRGPAEPENELIGVVFACSLDDPDSISLSQEHSDCVWVTATEALELLTDVDPSTEWFKRVIERTEEIKRLLGPRLLNYFRESCFELG